MHRLQVNVVAVTFAALSLLSCGGEDSSTKPASGGNAGTGAAAGAGGSGGSSGAGGSAGTGGSWQNPGCSGPENFVGDTEQLSIEVDLADYAAGEYSVRQITTLRPESSGNTVTLFGVSLLMGEASHGYAYDGQRATFCVEPFVAGQQITLTTEHVVSAKQQNFPAGNLNGLRDWGTSASGPVIAAYSAPFFPATWLLSPQTMPWVDAKQAGNASVSGVDLAVTTPDTSWSVVGPGRPKVEGTTWRFAITGSMPLFSLAFAASPSYVATPEIKTAGGLEVAAHVLPSSTTKMSSHLQAAAAGVDWMESNVGKYPWPTALTFAEMPGYPGGFEHTSGIWMGSSTINGGDLGDYVAVHEAVHHWWGNDVRIADWPHFWLSEGLTEWTTVFGILPTTHPTYAASEQKKYRDDAALLSYPKPPTAVPPGPLRYADGGDFATQLSENGLFFYRYGAAFLEMVHQRLQRDHSTTLTVILKQWFAAQHGKPVTTEQFRDFLVAQTNSSSWNTLFDEWVYATPCPTIELSNYTSSAGQVSFELHRTAGAGQGLSDVGVTLVGTPSVLATASLPKGVNSATVSVSMSGAPSAIVVDPDGFYVLRLKTAAGWSGPSVANSVP
ncbi:MAG TPA: M1 family aminopeptidase [Polyangiaceae bacterium]|nr:M1 family aminopeptidase [Polyangiaceae bacterium]